MICSSVYQGAEEHIMFHDMYHVCSVNGGCTRPWSQVVYATVWIMCTSMKHDMFFSVSRRNTAKSPNKYAILDDTPTPVRMHFCVRHRVCRSWSWVKLSCLCARLRLGVVPTYCPVNSWPSHTSSCEESLFPCLHTHIVEDFKLSPRNWRSWNAFLQIFQNFPFPRPTISLPLRHPLQRQKFHKKLAWKPGPRPA